MEITVENAEKLAEWFDENKRKLPWRDTGDPYAVWISEIMLQQTRIEAVIPKYLNFMKELPDVKSLASCSEDQLMHLWEGLGYYSRARNLQKCAAVLVSDYHSRLPESYEELLKLPGIGPYTAGAIASIAFGKPVKAVDGNVLRVIARVFDIHEDVRDIHTKELIETKIDVIYEAGLSSSFYRNFNQGLMELGETICLPHTVPDCSKCPWKSFCLCEEKKDWDAVPCRSSLKKRKIIERTLLVIRCQDMFLMHKRPDKGLLAGLYEFYGIDRFLCKREALEEVSELGLSPVHIADLPESRHIFTHLEWHMKAYEIEVKSLDKISDKSFIAADRNTIRFMAVPSAFKKYIQFYALK